MKLAINVRDVDSGKYGVMLTVGIKIDRDPELFRSIVFRTLALR